MSKRISLFIIAKNEEKNIAKCILSARKIVSEVVVVDAFSKDNTVSTCRELGALVFERAFDNFTEQKNFALSKTTGDWTLSLDADEVLSAGLAHEIKAAVETEEYNAFELVRENSFWGKVMHHGGVRKEVLIRLVRKDKGCFKNGLSHSQFVAVGKIGRLKNTFVHNSYPTVESYLTKFNQYTTQAARALYDKGSHCSVFSVAWHIPFDFIKSYLFQLGFLDGFRGLMWAVFSTGYHFTKSAKLWQLENRYGRKK